VHVLLELDPLIALTHVHNIDARVNTDAREEEGRWTRRMDETAETVLLSQAALELLAQAIMSS
jgi:hypothetical protein